MKSITDNIKSIIIVIIVVLLGTFASMRLMKIQVVGSDEIVTRKTYGSDALTYVREITPTRGEIMDFNGNVLVENTTRCDLVLQKAFFPEDIAEGNKCLLKIYKALLDRGYVFEDTLPITRTMPYEYTEEDVAEVVESLNLNVYATADNCIDKLISDYKIDDSYTLDEKRIIAGMRYTMMDKDFSYSLDLVLAKNVDHQTVVDMKELGNFCRGIEAVDAAERRIAEIYSRMR